MPELSILAMSDPKGFRGFGGHGSTGWMAQRLPMAQPSGSLKVEGTRSAIKCKQPRDFASRGCWSCP